MYAPHRPAAPTTAWGPRGAAALGRPALARSPCVLTPQHLCAPLAGSVTARRNHRLALGRASSTSVRPLPPAYLRDPPRRPAAAGVGRRAQHGHRAARPCHPITPGPPAIPSGSGQKPPGSDCRGPTMVPDRPSEAPDAARFDWYDAGDLHASSAVRPVTQL